MRKSKNYIPGIYGRIIKPVSDWLVALLGLIILFPLFVIVIICIKADSMGPAFFIQERLGLHGRVFSIFKFRSMIVHQNGMHENKLFENDRRITYVGRFMRRTSIDELPQLINIIKGEMSFIGPRPPLTYFPKRAEEYSDFEFQRFLVKPGISGLAQVRCREIHDWDVNIPIDIEYVHNISFIYDLKLFLASLFMFFRSDNVYRKD